MRVCARYTLGCLLLVATLPGCGESSSATPSGAKRDAKPVVQTVNYPLAYFARRIGGDVVDVQFLAPESVDPAFWRPDGATIRKFQEADLILDNGADYAKWLATATLSESKIIDTLDGLKEDLIVDRDLVRHSHGPGKEHSHAGTAFTVWLDPVIAMHQSARIADAFKKLAPQHGSDIDAGLERLHADLRRVEAEFEAQVRELVSRPGLASHPVYQYFARRFGLTIESLHWEPDQTPSPEQWEAFDELQQRRAADWMVWEDRPTDATLQALGDRGVAVFVLRPCGGRVEADLLEQWRWTPIE